MNQVQTNQCRKQEWQDPSMRVVYGVGMLLFFLGIFVPGAHTLMMVGLALIAVSYVL